jgi:mRNA-degrading endonuclease RelE of RelBE toxin-antitoxin system
VERGPSPPPLTAAPDVTPPERPEKDKWRLRVGDYRVIYRIDDAARVATILDVGPRGEIYGN